MDNSEEEKYDEYGRVIPPFIRNDTIYEWFDDDLEKTIYLSVNDIQERVSII
jgi:hypothetical protein